MQRGGIAIGLMLLVLGWLLVPAALVLLPSPSGRLDWLRAAFILAAFAVQILGVALFALGYRPAARPRSANPWRGAA